jgi:hypothetical protein
LPVSEQLRGALADRYRIEREIGAGGMATVYLAEDVKHRRKVALEVLRPELAAVLGPERFLSEIEVTANLQHPHLLPLFDSGEANGLLFYVMPYVQGESLRHRLDRERQLPVEEAARLAAAVASALAYAHRHDVIHRDLKPENILLHEGQPLVADFGIALAVSNAGGGRITQTGLSLGTPQYMSPEQATGDRSIDARSDIYSLGAVLYEMLVGDPPHVAGTTQAIIAKVLTERPPSVRAYRETVPEHIDAAIQCALAKLPADRFATAGAFADALTGARRVSHAFRSWPAVARTLLLAFAAGACTNAGGEGRPSTQRTYYVSASGDDASDGTSWERAWQSLARMRDVRLYPGDRILLRGGDTFVGSLIFDEQHAGTAAAPIVLSSSGSERAVIEAGEHSAIVLENTAGFAISGLILRGSWNAAEQTGNSGIGINLRATGEPRDLHYVRIDNVEVSGFRDGGIVVYSAARARNGTKGGFRDVYISRVVAHDNGDAGITVTGEYGDDAGWSHQNVYIADCLVYRNAGIRGYWRNSGNGALIGDVDGALVERCVAYGNGAMNDHATEGPAGIWAWSANNVIIQHSEACSNASRTLDGGGFGFDGGVTNSILQYNFSSDHPGAGFGLYQYSTAKPWSGNVVRYNLSENDGRRNDYGAISIWNDGSGIRELDVYNNTIFVTPAEAGITTAVRIWSDTDEVRFFNNLFITTAGVPFMIAEGEQRGSVWLGNAYWPGNDPFEIQWNGSRYASLQEWRTTTGHETWEGRSRGLDLDPQLERPGSAAHRELGSRTDRAEAYMLRSGSPLIDAGLDLAAAFSIRVGNADFFGHSVPAGAGFDIGMHEYAGDAMRHAPRVRSALSRHLHRAGTAADQCAADLG